jgi:spore germination cell wall hydrolase CwlJ-like protein
MVLAQTVAEFTSRVAWALRYWRNDLRLFWHAGDRGPWLFALILGLLVAAFTFALQTVQTYRDERRELVCLARNVYFEARGEPLEGQYAVAEVTMNRKASGRYPDTVCGVVYQQNWDPLRKRYVGAFSWTELSSVPTPMGEEWQRAWNVAEAVYSGRQAPVLGDALFYHATYVRPSWARGNQPVARIGRHVFYNEITRVSRPQRG